MVIWLRIPPSVNLTDCSVHISRQRTTFTCIRGESLNWQNHKLSQTRSIFFICGCMYVCFVNNTWPRINTTKWRLLKFWHSLSVYTTRISYFMKRRGSICLNCTSPVFIFHQSCVYFARIFDPFIFQLFYQPKFWPCHHKRWIACRITLRYQLEFTVWVIVLPTNPTIHHPTA